MPDTAVVIATRNRRETLLRTLGELDALPECPDLVVVDDASGDGTAGAVRDAFPSVHVIECAAPGGQSAGRNTGVRATTARNVAFCDDDSWFEPGALERATEAFERHPRLGAVAARVLVEPGGRLDPTCAQMAATPLGDVPGLGAARVLGFLCCGVVVRRAAFLGAGSFPEPYGGGGEEQLLAIDMATAGWDVAYMPDVVAHHQPARGGRRGRPQMQLRNDLWTAWLRRPGRAAFGASARLLASADRRVAMRGLAGALAGLHWVLPARRAVSPQLERAISRLG
jgi:N-acetylglucosaminyl-diphospho-decaprenol L-rhamnosyltransferase